MKNKLNIILGILIIIASMIWLAIFQRADNQSFHFWMLDVGQGMAVYIRFPNGFDVLYDGGPDSKVLEELGEVMPAWDREINLIISSHNHADHLVGLIKVLENFNIGEVWASGAIHTTETYQRFLEAIDDSGATIKICYVSGNCHSPNIANGRIEILFPFDDLTGARPDNQNNASLVVRIEYGETSILLPGEIEKESENEIVRYYTDIRTGRAQLLRSNILQSPHQGSHSSSTESFLEAVKPKDVLIAVGKNNQYGHPHKDIIKRYKNLGFNIYRTDLCGRIEVEASLKNYEIISNCKK